MMMMVVLMLVTMFAMVLGPEHVHAAGSILGSFGEASFLPPPDGTYKDEE